MTTEPLEFLRRSNLVAALEAPVFTPLTGGVASDIWRVDTARGPICVKRALAKLRVAGDWQAPVERNAYEVAWMQTAARLAPGSAPEILAHDPDDGVFAMQFLDPQSHPLWKTQLRDGKADTEFAAAVGTALARVHDGTARDAATADRFPTDAIFHAIRLEPYLEATARAHPELAGPLGDLVRTTAATRECLVHGDVSPKNILAGPDGPVFLDAECAWYGDPAFDLAFCLNHMLLKCLWTPAAQAGFLSCFDALSETYAEALDRLDAPAVLQRTARLLPGLFLARVDGKSPVEYLTREADKNRVRRCAARLLIEPPAALSDVRAAWEQELTGT